MKITLLSIALFLVSTGIINGQCLPSIPSNAVVVDSTQTINGGFDPVWVCSGDTLISNGGFHNIFLEPGSVMTTGGGIDTIFVKKNASFFMNGGIHYIYYENILDLNINGGIPTLDSCSMLAFDYLNAPLNGCFTGPVASFSIKDSSLCENDCIDFTNQSLNTVWWQWSFPGGTPSSDTVANPTGICYHISGVYDVILIAGNSNGADTLLMSNLITVNALPSVVITQNLNVLTATPGFATYQWYFGNVIINGANNNTLNAFQNGTYYLYVASANGCDTIVSYVFSNLALTDIKADYSIRIIPNPTTDYFELEVLNRNIYEKGFDVEIINPMGQVNFSKNGIRSGKTRFDALNLENGINLIRVRTNGSVIYKRLIKQ